MSHALALRMSALRVAVWFEYVSTLSNISDGGSRIGTACEMAVAMKIALQDAECPAVPLNLADHEKWRVFWS